MPYEQWLIKSVYWPNLINSEDVNLFRNQKKFTNGSYFMSVFRIIEIMSSFYFYLANSKFVIGKIEGGMCILIPPM